MAHSQELALPLVGGAINAKTVSDACTPALEKVLTLSTDADDFARRVAKNDQALADLRERGPMIVNMARPLDPTDVFRAVQPLMVMYDPPEFGDGRAGEALEQNWKAAFCRALRDVPYEALEHAVSERIRFGHPHNPRLSHKFPTPDQLIELAAEKTAKIQAIAWRIKVALEKADKNRPVVKTADDIAEVKAFLADLKAGGGLSRPIPSNGPGESRAAMSARLRAAAGV